jgi:putative two-component system response regulator
MAVADVYDALICRRVYKPGMPHAQAVEIIRQGRGTHFDPDICDAFLANNEQFHAIAERFVDSDQDLASKRVAQ